MPVGSKWSLWVHVSALPWYGCTGTGFRGYGFGTTRRGTRQRPRGAPVTRASASYNRVVRIFFVLSLAFALAGCQRSARNDTAVRQGVIDYLSQKGLNTQAMDVNVTNLNLNGNQADAKVTIT